MRKTQLFGRFILWRLKNLSQRQFMVSLALIAGLMSGLAAVLLKNAVHYTHEFLTGHIPVDGGNLLYLAYPFTGILLTVIFVRYVVKDNISHGISRILYAISRNNSHLRTHNTYSSFVASTLTIGFGGSVGAEAPIVLTGSALASTLGKLFRLNYKQLTLLIGCGAAGAVAGIFKAPIAGLVFTLEVLMLDLTMASIIPLLVSAVTAATVSTFLLGQSAVFIYTGNDSLVLSEIPFYILLGVLAALISYYFTELTLKIETWFSAIKKDIVKMLVGGIALGILIFLFPPLYGEGYTSLQAILSGNSPALLERSFFYSLGDNEGIFVLVLLLILGFKVAATAITTGSGGVGGVFAPSLFLGGLTGYILAFSINTFTPWDVSETTFTLIGMAGVMTGVMHAPLTAIFLIAELTGGYNLFIPLIITSAISYQTIIYFEPNSLYTKRLALRGELFTHDKDKNILSVMKVRNLIETNFIPVDVDGKLRDLVEVVSRSPRNIFPVVDKKQAFQGVIIMDDIRSIMFKPELYDTVDIHTLMFTPEFIVSPDDSMEEVANKFKDSNRFNLVVLEDGKYLGFVSKARVFSAYRKLLKEFSQDG